ncbi:MAG: PQQ-binding-like beta-propeller repeat protein [bacterium]|nr:PQQ-binding-like beta-propeller repeat protein [bacterium]
MKITCPKCGVTNFKNTGNCKSCNSSLEDFFINRKKKRIRKLKIFLTILVCSGLVFGLFRFIDWQLNWTNGISRIIPVDANNDGIDDLIVCYAPHKGAEQSLVKAVDLANDSVLWETKLFPIKEGVLAFQQYINADKDVIIIVEKRRPNRIAALSTATGKTLWQKKFEEYQESWMYNHIFIRKESLITFYDNETLDIVSINKKSGIVEWKIPFKEYTHTFGLKAPVLENNTLFISSQKTLHTIDIASGTIRKKTKIERGLLWKWRDRVIIFNETNNSLYNYNVKTGSIQPYTINGKPFHFAFPLNTNYIGLYKDTIVYFTEKRRQLPSKKYLHREQLVSQSLLTGTILYKTALPEGYSTIFQMGYRYYDEKHSYFNNISTPYLPLLVLDYNSNSKNNYQYQWAIIDMKKGTIQLPGKVLAANRSMCKYVTRHNNSYLFDLRIESYQEPHEKYFTLLFNGETGEFDTVYYLNYNDTKMFYWDSPHRFWQANNNIVYGYSSSKGEFWAIDLKTKKSIYHDAGGLDLHDGRKEFKKHFEIEIKE